MRNRCIPLLAGIILSFCADLGHAESLIDDWTPHDRGLDYYRAIWTALPFVPAANAGPVSPMADRYVITGYAHLSEGDVVFIFDRKMLSRFTLSTKGSSTGEVLSVSNQGDIKRLTAKIRVDGDVGVISYDQGSMPGQEVTSAPSPAPATAYGLKIPNVPSNGELPPVAGNKQHRRAISPQ